MAHTTADSNGRAAAPAEELGRPKVLVVAYPDLANAVYEALGFDAPPAPGGREPARTVSALCSQLFPARAQPPAPAPRHAFAASLRGVFGAEDQAAAPAQSPPQPEDSHVSLFEWGGYDFVIIQDMWAGRSDSGAPTLEPVGYELVRLDYYERGNFNTKKIVLVTDEEFLVRKWKHQGGGAQAGAEAVDFRQIVRKAFDEKDAFPLVNLNHPDALSRLREAVFGVREPDEAVKGGAVAPAPDARFRRGVRKEIAAALSLYIKTRAEVVFVDDELEELRNTFREVAGEELGVGGGARGQQNKSVLVADTRGKAASPAEDFEQLVAACEGKFLGALRGGQDYVLFVTDILFKRTSWEQTGIDLIQQLRRQLTHSGTGRFGIVAFTGFTTPFIAMSSYQRGADFVVPKLIRGKHDAGTAGTDRLLMTLAALCFQKSFLRAKRREAWVRNDSDNSARASSDEFARSLRHLQDIIPQHTVSIHVNQEWLDTCYLLDAMTIYQPGSPILGRVLLEMNEKYD
ncbi:MAG TPA: hypothetical protein VG148_13600 [Pyrinomonadaceae bacterium]|nr:hypothetical protein [Pyrinomonadaceae bacterium]